MGKGVHFILLGFVLKVHQLEFSKKGTISPRLVLVYSPLIKTKGVAIFFYERALKGEEGQVQSFSFLWLQE